MTLGPVLPDVLDHGHHLELGDKIEVVDEDLAVEVVNLMLEGPGEQSLALHLLGPASGVKGLHRDMGPALNLGEIERAHV